jgi:ankyrin repeat protein
MVEMADTTSQEFPLHAAARRGDHELLTSMLVSSRVSKRKSHGNGIANGVANSDMANVRDAEGFTPLHAAAERGHVHCIKILLKSGSAINAKDLYGRRPIRIFL